MNTNEGSFVEQSGNDVEGYRPRKVLFQPNVRVILQYSVKPRFHIIELPQSREIAGGGLNTPDKRLLCL